MGITVKKLLFYSTSYQKFLKGHVESYFQMIFIKNAKCAAILTLCLRVFSRMGWGGSKNDRLIAYVISTKFTFREFKHIEFQRILTFVYNQLLKLLYIDRNGLFDVLSSVTKKNLNPAMLNNTTLYEQNRTEQNRALNQKRYNTKQSPFSQ